MFNYPPTVNLTLHIGRAYIRHALTLGPTSVHEFQHVRVASGTGKGEISPF